MEVPYVHGKGNPLRPEPAAIETEKFAKEFDELQKQVATSSEKERSRKRHQQEQVEETKKKSTDSILEQRALSPSAKLDREFSKSVAKSTPTAVPTSLVGSGEGVSSLHFETDDTISSTNQVKSSTPLPPETRTAAIVATQVQPVEDNAQPADQPIPAMQAPSLQVPAMQAPEELVSAVDATLLETPLVEEKLGKEYEIEQGLFSPEKNLSTTAVVQTASALNPYTRLTPQMMEMFDDMILHMQIMVESDSDIRETSFVLGGKRFENSDLRGLKITIQEHQKTAPMQYNVKFEGSPEAINKISKKTTDALTSALAHGKYSFTVHRFETQITTETIPQNPFENEPEEEEK